MASPLRIAVNARALEPSGSPLARLPLAPLVERLASAENLELELFATGPITPGSAGFPPVHVASSSKLSLGPAFFDQVHFPRAAGRSGAHVLLILHPSAPIAAAAPVVTWYGDGQSPGAIGRRDGRLGRSLAAAGMRGATSVLHPVDLPADTIDVRWVAVPPGIPAEFFIEATSAPPSDPTLPESFVLAVCESPATLPLLLSAWTWVESSLGDLYGLLLAAPDEEGRAASERAAAQWGLAESVRSVVLGDEAWPAIIHGAAALLHGGARRNAEVLRWALAGGLPVAAPATPVSESIVGQAGYLVSPPQARALGAACLTLLVEEEMAASLRAKGKERAGSYRVEAAATAWAGSLRQAATSRGR